MAEQKQESEPEQEQKAAPADTAEHKEASKAVEAEKQQKNPSETKATHTETDNAAVLTEQKHADGKEPEGEKIVEDYPSATLEEKLAIPYIEKSNGNIKAHQGDYEGSMRHYSKALLGVRYLRDGRQIEDEVTKKRLEREVEIPVNLNMALCNLTVKNYAYAIRYSTAVLDVDPLNCKALYRRGVGYRNTAEVEFVRLLLVVREGERGSESGAGDRAGERGGQGGDWAARRHYKEVPRSDKEDDAGDVQRPHSHRRGGQQADRRRRGSPTAAARSTEHSSAPEIAARCFLSEDSVGHRSSLQEDLLLQTAQEKRIAARRSNNVSNL